MMSKNTLLIHGSFGSASLAKVIHDWSQVKVIEMDAVLPAPAYKQGAEEVLRLPMMAYDESVKIEARVYELLDLFLTDRVTEEGLETGRAFRAAGISIESFMMLSPYLLNLRLARQLVHLGNWEKIIVSPGAGVSTLAWRQLASALGIPFVLLPVHPQKPPALWRLRRKWQRWRLSKRPSSVRNPTPSLPVASVDSPWVSADPRLNAMLARDVGMWSCVPTLPAPSEEELSVLRARYLSWWDRWWTDWKTNYSVPDALDDTCILETLGRHLCEFVYPLHAWRLRQTRDAMKVLSPRCLLVGAMRGKPDLMWLLAARERGVKTGAYTLDDPVDPGYSFESDLVFCDDARQRDLALQRGIPLDSVFMTKTHRPPSELEVVAGGAPHGARPCIVLADTFFSGWKITATPGISLWAMMLLVETARLLPECDFHIKFHPLRERPQEKFNWGGFHQVQLWQREVFFKSLRPPENISLCAPEARLSEMLKSTAVLLNIQSYAAFEAYAMKVPVIHVAEPEREPAAYARLLTMGAAQMAESPERLAELIVQNIKDSTHIERQTELQQQFLKGFYATEGLSLGEATRQAVSAQNQ